MIVSTFIEIVEDLNCDLDKPERYRRLVSAIRSAIPCDAIALLKLDGIHLIPMAVHGLKAEALARYFVVDRHPRLKAILQSREIVHFDAASELPDPYDGLIDNGSEQLHVHDCMGSSIVIDGQLWGVLTLDAMNPGSFDALNSMEIRATVAVVAAVIKASLHIEALEMQLDQKHQIARQWMATERPPEIIGSSHAIAVMRDEINAVAVSDLSVLITGETGVGKELVAKSIHQKSHRVEQPLVQINCAALPENIIESELFGHVKGAFSGALSERKGRFELADGGTLFLDEIGELPLPGQAKLLRVLQSGEIQRVGSDKAIVVNVRIIAATNRDLQKEVKEGRFRADLYHRLSVYPLPVPPLRDRENDFLLLAGHFLEKNQQQLGVAKLRLTRAGIEQLARYDWPGNVRELKHLLSRAALKAITEQGRKSSIVSVDSHHLNLQPAENIPSSKETFSLSGSNADVSGFGLRESVDEFQRKLITEALEKEQGVLAAAARALRVDRSNLVRTMQRLGIAEPGQYSQQK